MLGTLSHIVYRFSWWCVKFAMSVLCFLQPLARKVNIFLLIQLRCQDFSYFPML